MSSPQWLRPGRPTRAIQANIAEWQRENAWDVIEHARKTLFAEVGESPPEVQADVVYSHVVPTLIDASKQARGKGWTATIMKERYMIEYDLDTEHSILHVQPKSAIERDDFAKVAEAVDPHIEATGGLAGLIIEAPAFPGWESLGAMVNHLRFVRDHHKRIKRIGVVTDSHLGDFAEHLASHFVSAEIRHFPAGQIEAARQWIINGS